MFETKYTNDPFRDFIKKQLVKLWSLEFTKH